MKRRKDSAMVDESESRLKKYLDKYLVALSLATLFFIIGILIGSAITSSKIASITTTEESLRLEMLDIELQGKIAEYNPCGTYYLYALGDRLSEIGTKLVMLENQLGKKDKRVIELKKPYTLLQVQHYLLIKNRVEKCNENYVIVLFFYSNKPEFIDESEKQGYVLSYLGDKYGYERIKVYSIDGDLDLGVVKALKEMNNVTVLPTTIVNDKMYVGFHPREEFERYF